jgi:glutamate racemase
MHILITDSGVGGLSVCAYAERFLRKHDIGEAANLTYVNASPENDFGYNSMGSRSEKLENFNRFLNIISETYSPDSIYIACNTLSVLFSDTQFSKTERIPVQGIVETGVNRLFRDLGRSPRSAVAIFGTVTTIEENTYPNLLQRRGIDGTRIISQACPSLADTISEDLRGSSAKKKIEKYVDAAIEKSNEETTDYLTYLACTHYGYRREYFSTAFEERGIKAQVLNPNEFVIEDLFGKYEKKLDDTMGKNDVSVEFITRYKIPDTALETIASFLDDVSPKTVEAFTNYTHAPDLF